MHSCPLRLCYFSMGHKKIFIIAGGITPTLGESHMSWICKSIISIRNVTLPCNFLNSSIFISTSLIHPLHIYAWDPHWPVTHFYVINITSFQFVYHPHCFSLMTPQHIYTHLSHCIPKHAFFKCLFTSLPLTPGSELLNERGCIL